MCGNDFWSAHAENRRCAKCSEQVVWLELTPNWPNQPRAGSLPSVTQPLVLAPHEAGRWKASGLTLFNSSRARYEWAFTPMKGPGAERGWLEGDRAT